MSKGKLVKAAGIVMIISLISRVVGLLRDVMMGNAFGTTYQTDAYNISLVIPVTIFGLFGLAITNTFIPILSESYSKNGKEDMFDFANSIMNILMLLSSVLCILGWIFAPILVKVIASKFTGDAYTLTVYLTKISIINLLFMSMNSGYMAILQTLDEFIAPTLVGVVMNIPIILYILLGSHQGIEGLTIATVIGNGIQILIQIPWLIKNNYKYSFKINWKDSRIHKMLLLIAPVVIGSGINQINTLVEKTMASGLPAGSITALDYSNKLNGMIYFTFAAAIVTVIYPSLSREGIGEDFETFKNSIRAAVNNMNLIIVPAAVGMIILRVNIITILFKHGAFDERAVQMTATALFYLLFGIIFWGIRDVFNRAFYAIQDTKTPMINGAIGVTANMILCVILVKTMGIGGLTLATSISAAFCCVLLIKDLRKKIGNINGMEILVGSIKIITAAAVMGGVVFFLDTTLSGKLVGFKGEVIKLILCMVIGSVVYCGMLLLLKVKEFMIAVETIKRKLKLN